MVSSTGKFLYLKVKMDVNTLIILSSTKFPSVDVQTRRLKDISILSESKSKLDPVTYWKDLSG